MYLYDVTTSSAQPILNWPAQADEYYTSAKSYTASYLCDTSHTYQLYLYINDYSTTSIMANISMSVLNQRGTSSIGGGIRIESIESYNNDNTLQKRDVYKYGASENDGGYLITASDEIKNKNYIGVITQRNRFRGTGECIAVEGYRYTFIGQSYYPTVNFQGANVVYNYVTRYEYNNNKPNGKTMYQYILPTDYTVIGNPGTFAGKERIDHNIATSLQQVNPYQLSSESNYHGKPGQDMVHEVTESYQAGKLSLQKGVDSGPEGTPGSVYDDAHQAAADESGMKYMTNQDANGKDVNGPVHGGSTIYFNRIKGKPDNIIYIQPQK